MPFFVADLIAQARGTRGPDLTEEIIRLRRQLLATVVGDLQRELQQTSWAQVGGEGFARANSSDAPANASLPVMPATSVVSSGAMVATASAPPASDASLRWDERQVQELTRINREGVRIKNLAEIPTTARFG